MELIWEYFVVFVMAAVPWLEILIVIPIAVGMGLDPWLTAVVSFVGNFLPVAGIIYLLQYMEKTTWYKKRQERKKQNAKKDRGARGRKVFQKYGLPGLALLGPAITGIHLAAVIALSFRAEKHATFWWMAVSLGIWTVVVTIGSVLGVGWITS
ncbi:small multi-drug export protein [Alkalicoccus urumqiensis]|uniref:Small multidrug efflux protein-like protein n=1 Tax=Alkalicoccus urumqiensis TaxID=1548213 RepID=A0A2P6MIM9_ALKUR|nr:small multi-drug export protein [Alkalicoccus urumqiensis]PRO66121.1 small multidrug efflux protein - like protein [Alkalicoccus urumqiensis]